MIYDNVGRWVEDNELASFGNLPFNERLKWLREELNKLYIGEYSVKRVAVTSGVISHTGLYKLEDNSDNQPRQSTITALADYYQVSVSIFSAKSPDRFFLGKQYRETDIRKAHYEVEIKFTVTGPLGGEPPIDKTFNFKARHLDAIEMLMRLENEQQLIESRLDKQGRLDEAWDILKRRGKSID